MVNWPSVLLSNQDACQTPNHRDLAASAASNPRVPIPNVISWVRFRQAVMSPMKQLSIFVLDTSVCQLAGDPHCKQFNALPGEPLLNLNGHCKYNMVTTYCKPGRGHGWFELHASFMSANEGKSAFMQKLSITYHNDVSSLVLVLEHCFNNLSTSCTCWRVT